MKKILLILGHTRLNSFCGALADNYQKGVQDSKGDIKRINLIEKSFDYNLVIGTNDKNITDDVSQFQEDILWSNHLVFVYPTRWYNVPAILKAFLDRVFLSGFAYKYKEGNKLLPEKLLKGRTAHVIITADGPSLYYYIFGNPAIKIMKMTLERCGIKVVKITRIFGLRSLSELQRKQKLQKVFEDGQKLI